MVASSKSVNLILLLSSVEGVPGVIAAGVRAPGVVAVGVAVVRVVVVEGVVVGRVAVEAVDLVEAGVTTTELSAVPGVVCVEN